MVKCTCVYVYYYAYFLLPINCFLDWEKNFWDPRVGDKLVEGFPGLLQDELLEGLLRLESWRRRASQSGKFNMLGFWRQVATGRNEVDSPRGTIVEIPAKFALMCLRYLNA